MFQVILFDIDGTLIRSGGAGKLALANALRHTYSIEAPKVDVDYGGRTDLSLAAEILNLNQVDPSIEEIRRFLGVYVEHLEDAMVQSEGLLLPGVRELLQVLSDGSNVEIGLLTGNIRQGAFKKLEHFDLGGFFSFGGYGDNCKDRSDIAREALLEARAYTNLELEASKVLVVGDTPSDVSCARAIGAAVLAVDTGFASSDSIKAANPDYFWSDLSDLRKFEQLCT